ncbi:terpene synthase family protein [Streptomyces yaizuensis]|uniref:Terpene synthase n=1 Tax=Streptomyces yaizuensis TaxID=2989713 RepID=A0ABQ5NSK7_9ACTN|nr:terpene synthase family protein [Streptomyces sp. YSPA8]GLF93363.1 hypothetical protein SYYSPA8_03720 [Streptomyces sp. YSPA8]
MTTRALAHFGPGARCVLPELPALLTHAAHPRTAELEARHDAWFLAHHPFADERERDRFLAHRSVLWTSVVFPTTDDGRFHDLARLTSYLFALDDLLLDHGPDGGRRARAVFADSLTVIRDGTPTTDHGRALAGIWADMRPRMPVRQRDRLVAAVQDFARGCFTETASRATGTTLDFATYVEMRIGRTLAAGVYYVLTEYAAGVDLADGELAALRPLHRSCGEHLLYANDLFSFRAEHFADDHVNAICVLIEEGACLQGAVDRVAGLLATAERDVAAALDAVLASPPGASRPVRRYLAALEHVISGNLAQSRFAPRYHGTGDHIGRPIGAGEIVLWPDRTTVAEPAPTGRPAKATPALPTGLRYPWPERAGALERDPVLAAEEQSWYADHYADLPPADLARYRRQGLTRATASLFPDVTDRAVLRPLARFMIWLTVWDDQHESVPVPVLRSARDRAAEIMTGARPTAADPAHLRLLALAHRELREVLPAPWAERWASSFHDYATHGVLAEAPFRHGERSAPPSLACLELIREHSIGMYPYQDLIDASLGRPLPDDLLRHPAVRRARALTCRIATLQNDVHSLDKELDSHTSEIFNAVLLLRREQGCSLPEALTEVVALHDRYVTELDGLLRHLTDLDPRLADAVPWVERATWMITGLDRFYRWTGGRRYRPGGFVREVPRGAALPR